MPLTNPWLAGSAPDRQLPRHDLEERILNLLSTHNLAVVATVNRDGSPAATPVRYCSLGLEIFYTSWNASAKSRNLRRDPRVSAGIVAPLASWPHWSDRPVVEAHRSSARRERSSVKIRPQQITGRRSDGSPIMSNAVVRS